MKNTIQRFEDLSTEEPGLESARSPSVPWLLSDQPLVAMQPALVTWGFDADYVDLTTSLPLQLELH